MDKLDGDSDLSNITLQYLLAIVVVIAKKNMNLYANFNRININQWIFSAQTFMQNVSFKKIFKTLHNS